MRALGLADLVRLRSLPPGRLHVAGAEWAATTTMESLRFWEGAHALRARGLEETGGRGHEAAGETAEAVREWLTGHFSGAAAAIERVADHLDPASLESARAVTRPHPSWLTLWSSWMLGRAEGDPWQRFIEGALEGLARRRAED